MPTSIHRSAQQCAESFTRAIEWQQDSQQQVALDDQLARFKLWAGNLGVFASGNASADYRLREDDTIKNVMTTLLSRVNQQLCALWAVPEDVSEASPNGKSSDRGDDENPSSAASSDSHFSVSAPSEDSTSSVSSPPVAMEVRQIRDEITQLYRLSAIIKKPRSLRERSRVENFVERHSVEDDSHEFESYASWKLKRMFPDTEDFLLGRLAEGLVFRRKKLLYRKYHRIKLAQGVEDAFLSGNDENRNTSQAKPASDSMLPRQIVVNPADATSRHVRPQGPISVTNASSIDKLRLATYPKSLARSRTTASAGASRARLDVPRPPAITAGAQEVECPYCSHILQRTDLQPARWTRHIVKDIDPYMCIFRDCSHAAEQYATRQDWVAHMQHAHNSAHFCLFPGHENKSFQSELDFDTHMKLWHNGQISDAQLPMLHNKSLKPMSQLFRNETSDEEVGKNRTDAVVCPFCSYNGSQAVADAEKEFDRHAVTAARPSQAEDDRSKQAVSDTIQSHIAGHLEEVAILSIPELEDVDEVSNERASDPVDRSRDSVVNDLPQVDDEDLADDVHNALGQDENIPDVTNEMLSSLSSWHQICHDITMKKSDSDLPNTMDSSLQSFMRRYVLDQLPGKTLAYLQDHYRRKQPPTRSLLSTVLQLDEFKAILDGSENCLLCTGEAGVAKTELAWQIVEHLQSRYHGDHHIGISYIPLSSRDPTGSRGIPSMMILKHLLETSSATLPSALWSSWTTGTSTIEKMITAISPSISKAFVIIDGLDEYAYEQQTIILIHLFELQSALDIRLIIMSRSFDAVAAECKDKTVIDLSKHFGPDRHAYTVAWICTLELEKLAATAMFDEVHPPPAFEGFAGNSYNFGCMGAHNVIIVCLAEGRSKSASQSILQLSRDFSTIQYYFIVGLGCGVPSEAHDIRLGDVVVGMSTGVIEIGYDRTTGTGTPIFLMPFIQAPFLQWDTAMSLGPSGVHVQTDFDNYRPSILSPDPRLGPYFSRPDVNTDQLFAEDHDSGANVSDDGGLSRSKLVSRKPRKSPEPVIHHGAIAVTNIALQSAKMRDNFATSLRESIPEGLDILCFGFPTAALIEYYPCMVICGICDYGDSHKNDLWEGYAAMTAAAYTKEVIRSLRLEEPA